MNCEKCGIETVKAKLCRICYSRKYYHDHKDKMQIETRLWQKLNIDRMREYNKKYRKKIYYSVNRRTGVICSCGMEIITRLKKGKIQCPYCRLIASAHEFEPFSYSIRTRIIKEKNYGRI